MPAAVRSPGSRAASHFSRLGPAAGGLLADHPEAEPERGEPGGVVADRGTPVDAGQAKPLVAEGPPQQRPGGALGDPVAPGPGRGPVAERGRAGVAVDRVQGDAA
nr:hypothetical protein GCM10020092_096820 [Actinoplanes digitatis]